MKIIPKNGRGEVSWGKAILLFKIIRNIFIPAICNKKIIFFFLTKKTY